MKTAFVSNFLGSWCLAAFVLVNAYSITTLVSNLTALKNLIKNEL